MIHTSLCTLLDITYPIVLGGMGTGTSVPLVAAVSQAGGFGTLGATNLTAAQVREQVAAIRAATDKPFGVNYLLFRIDEASFAAALQSVVYMRHAGNCGRRLTSRLSGCYSVGFRSPIRF